MQLLHSAELLVFGKSTHVVLQNTISDLGTVKPAICCQLYMYRVSAAQGWLWEREREREGCWLSVVLSEGGGPEGVSLCPETCEVAEF